MTHYDRRVPAIVDELRRALAAEGCAVITPQIVLKAFELRPN